MGPVWTCEIQANGNGAWRESHWRIFSLNMGSTTKYHFNRIKGIKMEPESNMDWKRNRNHSQPGSLLEPGLDSD
jgi:hypothetical protein